MIILASTVLAKIAGFLREAAIAAIYGTSYPVDLYLAGITLPAMAVTVAYHAVPNAFVPLFSTMSSHEQVRRQAWKLFTVACLLSCGIWWLAAPIASVTNSGFPEPLRSETVAVLRIGAATVALATAEALLRSQLLARKRFIRPGLSVLLYSAVMVIAIWLYPDGGPRTLAWGTVAGTAASALCNLTPMEFIRKRTRRVSEAAAPPSLPDSGLWIPIVLLIDCIRNSTKSSIEVFGYPSRRRIDCCAALRRPDINGADLDLWACAWYCRFPLPSPGPSPAGRAQGKRDPR